MTIDEAIQHCQEKVQEQAKKGCYSFAEEHHQLAEWLIELKAYKEQRTGLTNGDVLNKVLKANFPKTLFIRSKNEAYRTMGIAFSEEWWNSPYKEVE